MTRFRVCLYRSQLKFRIFIPFYCTWCILFVESPQIKTTSARHIFTKGETSASLHTVIHPMNKNQYTTIGYEFWFFSSFFSKQILQVLSFKHSSNANGSFDVSKCFRNVRAYHICIHPLWQRNTMVYSKIVLIIESIEKPTKAKAKQQNDNTK